MYSAKQGFSVIELFITLGVVVILGFLTYPFYANYKHRLYYAEINQAAVTYKNF
jgi:Tfp pilus assembly protein PilE